MPTDPTGLTEDTGTVLALLGFEALCIVAIYSTVTPEVFTVGTLGNRGGGGGFGHRTKKEFKSVIFFFWDKPF